MKGGPRNWVAVHAHLRGGAGNHGDDRKDGSRLRCRVRIEWNDEDEDEDAGTAEHHDHHHDRHHDGHHDTLDRHVHLQHAVDMHAVDGLLTSEPSNGEHDMPNTEFDIPFEIWNDAFDQILSELAERQTAARTRMEQLIKERAALLEERQRLLVERERLRAKLESITADE